MKYRIEMKFNESILEIVTLELNAEGWKWGVWKAAIHTGRVESIPYTSGCGVPWVKRTARQVLELC